MARTERDSEGPSGPPVDWRRCDDATLVAGMRNGWEPAYAEFCARYVAMLAGLARRGGVRPEDRSALVMEFLDDAALRLGCSTLPAPRSMAAYLVAGFRARLAQLARGEKRRQSRENGLTAEIGTGSERAVAESVSAYSIACTAGPDVDGAGTTASGKEAGHSVRCRLVETLLGAASDSERKMLGLMAQRMPQRDIAGLLGVTPGAIRVRILRLRERLRREAIAYANTVSVDEALALQRILSARAGHGASRESRSSDRPNGEDNLGRTS